MCLTTVNTLLKWKRGKWNLPPLEHLAIKIGKQCKRRNLGHLFNRTFVHPRCLQRADIRLPVDLPPQTWVHPYNSYPGQSFTHVSHAYLYMIFYYIFLDMVLIAEFLTSG